jgi:hypothetical protein
MRSYKKYLIWFFIMSASFAAFGQATPPTDSTLATRVRRISGYLSLSSPQEKALLGLEGRQQKSQDSLRRIPLSPDQRTPILLSILQDHDRQLKAILNEAQWKKYKDLMAAGRAAFLKHAAEKGITVRELPGQNP